MGQFEIIPYEENLCLSGNCNHTNIKGRYKDALYKGLSTKCLEARKEASWPSPSVKTDGKKVPVCERQDHTQPFPDRDVQVAFRVVTLEAQRGLCSWMKNIKRANIQCWFLSKVLAAWARLLSVAAAGCEAGREKSEPVQIHGSGHADALGLALWGRAGRQCLVPRAVGKLVLRL